MSMRCLCLDRPLAAPRPSPYEGTGCRPDTQQEIIMPQLHSTNSAEGSADPARKSRPLSLGQGLVEYALILVLVAIVSIGTLAVLGSSVSNSFEQVNNALSVSIADAGSDGPGGTPGGPTSVPPTNQPTATPTEESTSGAPTSVPPGGSPVPSATNSGSGGGGAAAAAPTRQSHPSRPRRLSRQNPPKRRNRPKHRFRLRPTRRSRLRRTRRFRRRIPRFRRPTPRRRPLCL